MMSMQSNNFRWHHQKESHSYYYHLTPDKNGIIEHFLGLKTKSKWCARGVRASQSNLSVLARLWSNDVCREGVREKGPDGIDSAVWLSCPSYLRQS